MCVALLAGYLVGVPLVWLARRGQALTSTDWLYVPFVGLGAVTLLAHQLVYFDVRVRQSAPAIWIVVAGLWGVLIGRYGWRTAFRDCPWWVLLATLLVYLVHGMGVVINGPDQYVGRLHTDRCNYISLAQFLADVPYSTDWDQVGQRPYLVDGLKLKSDRIGVMVLQAFLSVSAGEPASRTFECTILLGPALVVPALVLIARLLNFGRTEALLAATAGALLPALTTLHTLGFLANVSAIPFLLATIAAACSLGLEPSVRKVLLTALLAGATASLYTEFAPLLVALVGGVLVFGVLVGRFGWWRTPLVLASALAVLVLIYPKTENAAQLGPVLRTTMNTTIGNPLGWLEAKRLPGAAWVYDAWSINPPQSRRALVTALGVGLCALTLLGLARLLVRELVFRRPGPGSRNGAAVMALLITCFLIGAPVLFYDGRVNYQATKLFLSVAPLMALGVTAALRAPAAGPAPGWVWGDVATALRPHGWFSVPERGWLWRRGALVVVLLICGYGTSAMIRGLTKDAPAFVSHHQHAQIRPLNDLKELLRNVRNHDIVLAIGPGMIWNCDLAFAARRNRVWLACPVINDGMAVGCEQSVPGTRPLPVGRNLVDLTTVPATAHVCITDANPSLVIEGDKKLEAKMGPFEMWRVGPGPYRLITTPVAMRSPELDHPAPKKAP
jgi:hypothetical protein